MLHINPLHFVRFYIPALYAEALRWGMKIFANFCYVLETILLY